MSSPEETLKNFPDVFGLVIAKEVRERVILKGIEMEIKKYKTTENTTGIRISLLDNTSELFIKFNEFLASNEAFRPAEERALNMWSFATLCQIDPGLEIMEGAGFYVYQGHIIFNEEEKSASPMERLLQFLEYYKKRFNIRTYLREDDFSTLDMLEVT